MSDLIHLQESEKLRLQLLVQAINQAQLQLQNYIMELFLNYKLTPQEYKLDINLGTFNKIKEDKDNGKSKVKT
jgi:hypothetical protein